MSAIFRDATLVDAGPIAALHVANWREAYADVLDPAYLAGPVEADRLALWTARLAQPDPAREVVLADTPDGALAGFVCVYHAEDPCWGALIDNLHTSRSSRGLGIGKALLGEAARRAAARDPDAGLSLWVYDKNRAAIGFYRALGCEIVASKVQDWEPAQGETLLRCHWPLASGLTG